MNHNTGDRTMNHNTGDRTMNFQASNISDAPISQSIVDMADIYAIGQNQTSVFFAKYPHCKADPDQVVVVFTRETSLPPCLKDKTDDGKLAFSPRSFEATLSKGKLPISRGNDDRLLVDWKGLSLDYNLMIFLAKVYNAARKAAEKVKEGSNAGTSRKETAKEKECRERAERAEAACKAKDAAYLELMEKAEAQGRANHEFTKKVAQAVADLLANSQPKAKKNEAYTTAAAALKAMLNLA